MFGKYVSKSWLNLEILEMAFPPPSLLLQQPSKTSKMLMWGVVGAFSMECHEEEESVKSPLSPAGASSSATGFQAEEKFY